uniref:Reverse transcriptase domain-containing protein n=1 Tax=Haemonchus placei TaxID=6290 RepID=A0A0N4WNB9_HAEPC
MPSADASKYKVIVDDYRTDLLNGLQLIREEVRAKNEKYRAKMKEAYDERKNVNVLSIPAVGGRVFMKLPREKAGKHPKLTIDWDRPYRELQTDETLALITKIGSNEDAIKVQRDLLLTCPDDISNEQVSGKTRRKRVKRVLKISVSSCSFQKGTRFRCS